MHSTVTFAETPKTSFSQHCMGFLSSCLFPFSCLRPALNSDLSKVVLPRRPAERFGTEVRTFRPQANDQVSPEVAAFRNIYYINGVSLDGRESVYGYGQQLAKLCGQPVTLITDNQQCCATADYASAAAGKLSSTLGRKLEPVVNLIMQRIEADIAQGKTIKFFVHSKSSIVLLNALEQLRLKVGEQRWASTIAPKLEAVTAFGSAVHQWPSGVRVEHFEFSKDWVAKTTRLSDKIQGTLSYAYHKTADKLSAASAWALRRPKEHRPAVGGNNEEGITVVLKGNGAAPHYMDTYLKHYQDFLLAQYQGSPAVFRAVAVDGHWSPSVSKGVMARLAAKH